MTGFRATVSYQRILVPVGSKMLDTFPEVVQSTELGTGCRDCICTSPQEACAAQVNLRGHHLFDYALYDCKPLRWATM